MKTTLVVGVVLALSRPTSMPSSRAGDADKVHTVGKDGLVLQGKVEPTDPKVKLIVGDKFYLLPAKLFQVQLSPGKRYRVSMDSKEIDSVLVVQDMTGRQLAWDDDGGGDLNSLLTLDIPENGTCKIYAASLKGSGNFTLKVQEEAVVKGKVQEIGAGLEIKGELGKAKANTYQVKLAAGKTYVIDMISPNQKALDPLLRLLDAVGKQLAEDDDGGEGLNARIIYKVERAGIYQVVATCFGNGRGSFTLTVRDAREGERALTPEEQEKLTRAFQLNNRAVAHHKAGKTAEAFKPAQEALRLHREVLGEKHPKYATSLNNLAILYDAQGNYSKAEPLFQLAMEIRKDALGEKHPEYAASLDNLAGLYVSKGNNAKAEPLFRQALDIRKEVRGEKHPDYTLSLNNLAFFYSSQGNHAKAEPLYRQALDIRKEVLGENHPDYATSLSNLAGLYLSQGNHAKAEPLYKQGLDIVKNALGEKHPAYARSLNNLAFLYDSQGNHAQAEPLYRQALDIRKEVLGEKHSEYATSLNNLAFLYDSQGNHAQAEPLYRQALDIRKQVLGEKHPDYATSLSNLAALYHSQGNDAKAEPLFRRALDIVKEVLGEKHPDYARSLNNLASLYAAQENHAKAEPLFRQALEIRQQVLGEKHPAYATSLANLASLYKSQGNDAKAELLFRRAMEIRKEILGEKHPDYALSLNNLAVLYDVQRNYAQAEPLYRQALDIRQQVLGEKHPDYAMSLNNLAYLYASQGNHAKAGPLYLQALDIRKKVLGEKHPEYAGTLNNLAGSYLEQGDYARAEPLFRQALLACQVTNNAVLIDDPRAENLRVHPQTVTILRNHARALLNAGGMDSASEHLRAADGSLALALAILERVRQENQDRQQSKIQLAADYFGLFPARIGVLHKLFVLEKKPADLEAALATAEQGTARAFLETLGRSKANLLAGVRPILAANEEQLLEDLRRLDLRIDKESSRALDQRKPDLIGELILQRRGAEAKLQQLIAQMEKEHPQYAGLKYPRPCKLDEARACLAPEEVALLFVPGPEASYIVLVEARPAPGDKAAGLAVIKLAARAVLAEHVAALNELDSLALPARIKALGREAFDAILGPCKDRIEGKNLVLVPNDALCFLPFQLLVEEDGRYLVEQHRIRYAPSLTALHLINLWKEKRPQPTEPLFAVGDPVYESAQPPSNPRINTVIAARNDDVLRDLGWREGKEGFKRLVHSGQEVAEIARMLGAGAENVLTCDDASEAKLKAASAAGRMAKARHIHFATHGILGADQGKQPALVLNLVGNSTEDGFLHLDEITGLKLNADLVVLSACRTGQGRMARGEGVTGLARAFLYAGSKGVVCSLWSVDDRETANLMVDFYGHLQKGQPAADALREAQLAMIRAGKAPLYWAPFILIGE